MGTVAVTKVRTMGHMPQFRGKLFLVKITMSSSYATGGDVLPLTTLPAGRVLLFAPVSRALSTVKVRGENVAANGAGSAFKLAGTATAPKIQSFVGDATPTETANATNLSTVSFDAFVVVQ